MADKKYLSDEEVDELLLLNDLEGSSYFINPNYSSAILGYTEDGNIVYSYDKMVEEEMVREKVDYLEAADFINYNTLRVIPYMGDKPPIVIYELQ